MGAYILRRLLLIVPTILGILLVNFALIQAVPGGPIEQIIADIEGQGNVFEGFAGGGGPAPEATGEGDTGYIGGRGLPPEFIAELEREFGFDKPPLERFATMVWNYARFDFGESYFRSVSVVDLVLEKMPVSISLGLWSTLLAYLISLPLGVRKAVRTAPRFDTWTSASIIVAYAIPGLPVRDPAAGSACGGLLCAVVPAARACLGQLGGAVAAGQDRRLFLAHHAAGRGLDDLGLCHADAVDQEQLPRPDQDAVCDHRPRQGPVGTARAVRPCVPQRAC
jgi:hypothetical protein